MANVIVYSTESCPYCVMAKKFLEENSIPFKSIDVSSSQAAAQEMIRKSGQMGVPVIDIDGKIFVGFDRAGIKKALGL